MTLDRGWLNTDSHEKHMWTNETVSKENGAAYHKADCNRHKLLYPISKNYK